MGKTKGQLGTWENHLYMDVYSWEVDGKNMGFMAHGNFNQFQS